MAIFFNKTKKIELEIEDYLDLVEKGGLVYKQGVKYYFDKRQEEFETKLNELRKIEEDADSLRRNIETKLYIKTLIPESRGDVLGLLEHTDKVLNIIESSLLEFSVEIPDIMVDLQPLYLDLAENAILCVDCTVGGIRSYFRNLEAVRDFINKVQFYRNETNRLAEKIKRHIFRTPDIDLSQKIHMRYFSYHIERIAEEAEDVCDRLAIATIKKFE